MSFQRRDDSVADFRADLARLADVARSYAHTDVVLTRPILPDTCPICTPNMLIARWSVCPDGIAIVVPPLRRARGRGTLWCEITGDPPVAPLKGERAD